MSLYILPVPATPADEVANLATAAGVRFSNVETLRELILIDSEESLSVARVTVPVAKLAGTYADMVFVDIPTIVLEAPSSTYTEDFKSQFAVFPWITWEELETRLSKTGMMSKTPGQAVAQREGHRTDLDKRISAQLDPSTDRALMDTTMTDPEVDVP